MFRLLSIISGVSEVRVIELVQNLGLVVKSVRITTSSRHTSLQVPERRE